MINVEVQYELIVPKTDMPFKQETWQRIGEIVKLDIQAGIVNQIDVTGQPYPPLKPNTVASKQGRVKTGGKSKGMAQGVRTSAYPNKRLIDTTNLLYNQRINASPTQVEISIGPQRSQIGQYQQEGIKPHEIRAKGKSLAFITTEGPTFAKTVTHPGTAPVPFFGISALCIAQIDKYLDIEFDKWLRNT